MNSLNYILEKMKGNVEFHQLKCLKELMTSPVPLQKYLDKLTRTKN